MLKAISILLIAMVSIQFGASQAKQLFSLIGVAGTSTVRLMIASFIMILFFRPWRSKLTKEKMMSLFLYGSSLGLMNFSFYFALKRIPLGIAVALEFVGPLSVAILSSKKKIDYVWALLAAIGIFILIPRSSSVDALDPIGLALALLAGLFWALYIIFGKKAGDELHGGVAASLGMLVAAVIVLPFGLAIDGDKIWNSQAIIPALVVAIFGSALPYSLEMFALKKLPAQTFGVLMSLEPAVAALIGLIFLSEELTTLQWMAICCVITSSLGSSLTQKGSRDKYVSA
jgi:inner membrane transporter RhtA